jgi:hypothetical protein
VTFENYDGIGRYRTMDGGKAVDASSTLMGTKGQRRPGQERHRLLAKLANAPEVRGLLRPPDVPLRLRRSETASTRPRHRLRPRSARLTASPT